MTPLLQLCDVEKAFTLPTTERIDVLRGVCLGVHAGERVAIVGRSGSGKSTLLNILGLLDQPSSGRYLCDGRDVSSLDDVASSRLRGSFVGFIFQQFHLLDRRTALENVAEPALFAGGNARKARLARASHLLDQVGLSHRANSMPHLMSGGEKQRVAIARALARNPRLILADEPTGSLDVGTGRMVLDLLFDMSRSEQTALVLVTHDEALAARSDRVYVLEAGRLTEQAR